MDIVILALNSKYIHSSLAPWYLKAEVPEADVIEHTVNEEISTVVENILRRKPRILAISVYIWNLVYAKKVLSLIKAADPSIITVIGGPEVSYNAGEVLQRCTFVDYVICGEGEVPFAALCKYVLQGTNSDLPGVSYGKTLAEPYVGSGTPKSPYSEEYFHALGGRIAYFESSRGCPYSCAYCLSGRCDGMRFFDIQYVQENLVKLANGDTKTIKFVDRTFNADRRRALQILTFIKEGSGVLFPCDVCFHFELSGDLLDDDTIAFLQTVPEGLFQFEIGIQSFYPDTIQAIHRKTESETLKYRIRQLVEIGCAHIHTDLIAGLPYEGYEDFKNSFNEAYSLGADMLQLGFLKILHGTELETRVSEYGLCYSQNPPYEVYETPWLSREEIKELKIAENAVDRLHNSGRFRRVIKLCLPQYDRAYDFFYECGRVIQGKHGLNDTIDALYFFFCEKLPHMTEEIRDAFVCDRLATNSSRGLPAALYRPDSRLAQIKKRLNANENTAEKPHIRRNVAILYHANMAVYADYENKNNRGEYLLSYVHL